MRRSEIERQAAHRDSRALPALQFAKGMKLVSGGTPSARQLCDQNSVDVPRLHQAITRRRSVCPSFTPDPVTANTPQPYRRRGYNGWSETEGRALSAQELRKLWATAAPHHPTWEVSGEGRGTVRA